MAAVPVVKVIYGKPMLPDLARVLACLHEKEIKFELEDMNKGKRITQDILNLQISSHGHTPALQDGNDELFGSRKICKHIANKYGAYGYKYLLGNDPLARVAVEQWIQSEEQMFDPPSSTLVYYLAYKIESDEKRTAQSEKKLAKVLNLYEQRLGEFNFLAGNYFTLADLNHLPNTYYLENSDEYGYLFKDRKNVSRWWKNISNRESWKNVIKKFVDEGLQFKISEACGETDHSTSSSKNGLKNVPNDGLKKDGRKEEDKKDILENKTAFQSGKRGSNPSDNNNEQSFGKETKEGGAVKSKTKSQKDGSPLDNNNENSPSERNTKQEANKTNIEGNKDTAKDDEKDKSSSSEKRADGSKQHGSNKLENEGKKDDKDKGNYERKGKIDANKEYKESDPGTAGNKDDPKLGDKDTGLSGKEKEAGLNKRRQNGNEIKPDNKIKKDSASSEPSSGGKEDGVESQKASERKDNETDPNKKSENRGKVETDNQGKKSSNPSDDKVMSSSREAKEDKAVESKNERQIVGSVKQDEKDKQSSSEKKVDESKGRSANMADDEGKKNAHRSNDDKDTGKDERTSKTEENKEHKEGKQVAEGKKDDKIKDPSGKEKESDPNKKNENSGTTGQATQANKDPSIPNGIYKASSGNNMKKKVD